MNQFIQLLNQNLYSLSVVSLGASLVWGVFSVFLSPCHVASMPLIIGYINNREKPDLKTGFFLSLLFGLGVLVMIILMGVVTGLLGRMLGDVGAPVLIIVYLFLLLCGIWLLDLPFLRNLNISFLGKLPQGNEMGAFSLGFFYGLVLGPCSYAFMAPMIGIVFTQSVSQLWFGIALFVLYGIGHTGAIIFAGTFGSSIVKLFESKNMSNASLWIKRLCGMFLIIYAVFQIWGIIFR